MCALRKSELDDNVRVYKCKFCSGYHIGHYNKEKSDKGRYGL